MIAQLEDISSQPSTLNRASTSLLFAVPPDDTRRFASLPEEARRDLSRTFKALHSIHTSRNHQQEALVQAAKFGYRRGFKAETLMRKYYDFLRNGSWLVLVDKAKAGPAFWNTEEPAGLPEAFLDFWKTLCERNQRKTRPAHRELLRIWRTGKDTLGAYYKEIPGYPIASMADRSQPSTLNPQPDDYTGIPKGWSYENLQRQASDIFELTAARIGRAAAAVHRRKVLTTRAELEVGQYILFDDQVYDVKVNFPGNPSRKSMRPLGLNAMDWASASSFTKGFKPTLLGEDGSRAMLKEVDMMWFVIHVLLDHGINPRTGTHLVVEHGTAAIRPDFEERIKDALGECGQAGRGLIFVDRSGLQDQPAFAALFDPASKGNFRFKAPLESFFNLVRNEMAMLPAQTGLSRDRCPEELAGRDAYNTRLLKAAQFLPPERASLLKMPVLSWSEFLPLALEIYQRIDTRIDHDLEGWEKAGNLITEFRLLEDQPWVPTDRLLELPEDRLQAVSALLKSPVGSALTRTRYMSPQEVFSKGAKGLQKVGYELLPHLLGPDFGTLATVRGGVIQLKDQEIDPEPMIFNAWPKLQNGDTVRAYLNPFNPSVCVVAHPKNNSFLGILPRQAVVSRADPEAIKREMGAARKEEAERLAPLERRHAREASERTRMHKRNAAVLDGKPITDEEKARALELAANVAEFGKEAAANILSPLPDESQEPQNPCPHPHTPDGNSSPSAGDFLKSIL